MPKIKKFTYFAVTLCFFISTNVFASKVMKEPVDPTVQKIRDVSNLLINTLSDSSVKTLCLRELVIKSKSNTDYKFVTKKGNTVKLVVVGKKAAGVNCIPVDKKRFTDVDTSNSYTVMRYGSKEDLFLNVSLFNQSDKTIYRVMYLPENAIYNKDALLKLSKSANNGIDKVYMDSIFYSGGGFINDIFVLWPGDSLWSLEQAMNVINKLNLSRSEFLLKAKSIRVFNRYQTSLGDSLDRQDTLKLINKVSTMKLVELELGEAAAMYPCLLTMVFVDKNTNETVSIYAEFV